MTGGSRRSNPLGVSIAAVEVRVVDAEDLIGFKVQSSSTR